MPTHDPSLHAAALRGTPVDDEPELVRRAQLGSAAAFEKLVLLRGPYLHRFLSARLRHEADALDALQETLTAAWQGLPRLSSPSKFWPWICGIAAHKAADASRRRPQAVLEQNAHSPAEPESVLDLREALASLPEQSHQILLLRHVVGLSEEEVATALGIRVGTVKSRSARARSALRKAWR